MPYTERQRIKDRVKRWRYAYGRFIRRFVQPIRSVSNVVDWVTVAASLICLVALVIYAGFDRSGLHPHLARTIRGCQIVFLLCLGFNLTLNLRATIRQSRLVKWLVNIALLVTLLPLIYPRPEHPWIPVLERILYSRLVIYTILGAYSIVELSYGLIRVVGKRTNPSLMLSASFLFFIILGSMLLMMPRCTVAGISYVDSLFVASSAVCITGLTPIDVATTFTPLGLLVLALLIQIGALGVMTFTSFFALFFSGNTSIYSQLLVKDMIYSKSINALLPTLLYILLSTLVIELVGAVAIYFTIHGQLEMTLEEELVFSAFHSLSAFCNAGFSNLPDGMANPALLYGNQAIYIVVTILVMAGAIGFPILVNFKDIAKQYFQRSWAWITRQRRLNLPVHIYDVNTKIVLTTTSIVFVLSAVGFFCLEYHNTLEGMSLYDKIVQSCFNSVTPRSAGFMSVNPAAFLDVTLLMVLFQMWIGGASQSTAGGVKVNTVAAIALNLRSIVLGRSQVVTYHRTIALGSIRRANAVVALSIISYFVYSMLLVAFEPDMPVKGLVFEASSALFTVGSSLGVTAELSEASKITLCTAMFLGRVGIISLLVGVSGSQKDLPVRFPDDSIIIN
ncbi:MAG: potassium transporter [Bacteroidales bacterium]|nr:potassium transporter [Bacteroidales bacterium]